VTGDGLLIRTVYFRHRLILVLVSSLTTND
jgi:hypothetical protein